MDKILILINDAPYETEKAYNGLRLANQLNKAHKGTKVWIFLMAGAAACAVAGQKTPDGFYNIERMLKYSISKGSIVKICGSCAEARGLKNEMLIEGTELSTMADLADWVSECDKMITF